jgi:hypothetical protein
MTENLWTIAFDGPGDITEENAAALLDKELPNDIEAIYIPSRISRKQHGLRIVADWLTEVFGESGVQKTDNALDVLSKAETPVLVWLRGETDSEEDLVELTDALQDGVHVLDLSQGMDDINFDPQDAKEPEEPVAEPEQPAPARTRATRSPRTTKAAKAAETTTAPRGRRATTRTSKAADGGRAVTGTRPTPHPASQSTGPNGEDELASRRPRGKPRTMTEAAKQPEETVAVDPDAVDEDPRAMPSTIEELDRYIDDRIAHGFHLAELAMHPKMTPGRKQADGSEPTAYLDTELTFVVRNGVASLRGRGKPSPNQETFTMTRRQAIEEGLVEG